MKSDMSKNFVFGVIIGALLCLLYWYWQQSTQAEDGALALLDRLKAAQDKLRQAESMAAHSPREAMDDLTQIKGVGPVFAERLQRAGVRTIAAVAALSPSQLADILQVQPGRAERILTNI